METKILAPKKQNIIEAGRAIKEGKLVAFPTETVYGLGADGLNKEAVKKIYEVKGRPADNPMILHIASPMDLGKLVKRISPGAVALIETFWPGPLTLIFNKKSIVPDETTAGLDTVAIRIPDHPVALALITEAGVPIAAPSANISGSPSPTRAKDVLKDLKDLIPIILEGGDCPVGIESTVVDMTDPSRATILRPGIITAGEIKETFLNYQIENVRVSYSEDKTDTPKSPGMKYSHYAPKARMLILEGSGQVLEKEIDKLIREEPGKTGLIYFKDIDPSAAAHDFFSRLRDMDEEGTDLIIAVALDTRDEVAYALMNRMLKSAGYNIRKL